VERGPARADLHVALRCCRAYCRALVAHPARPRGARLRVEASCGACARQPLPPYCCLCPIPRPCIDIGRGAPTGARAASSWRVRQAGGLPGGARRRRARLLGLPGRPGHARAHAAGAHPPPPARTPALGPACARTGRRRARALPDIPAQCLYIDQACAVSTAAREGVAQKGVRPPRGRCRRGR